MKYPFCRQYDAQDCGPACLRMISEYYGKHFSLQYLKERSYLRRTGTTMLNMSDVAESLGFRTIGAKLTWEQLKRDVNLPCVISWNQQHFVVVYKIKKNSVIVGDPSQGILKYDTKAFLNSWYSIKDNVRGNMGIVLLFEPTAEFYNQADNQVSAKENKIDFFYLFKYLKPHIKPLLNILFGLFVGSCISLVFPFLTQAVVDVGIGNRNINFIILILVAQFVLAIGQAFNNLIKNWLMLHVTVRVNISLVSDFLGKLMKLPIAFFDTKRLGDILQRIKDFDRIQTFLTGELISMTMGIVSLIVYFVVMAGYNMTILFVFVTGSVLYITWILFFLKKRRKLDYMWFQESARNQSSVIQMINGMQEIKLNNCEKQKLWEWERIQHRLYDVSLKGLNLSQTQNIGGVFIEQMKNIIISFIAAVMVVNGNMTFGMMIAVQYIIGELNAPITDFISFIRSFQDTEISLERLNEIQKMKDEDTTNLDKISDIPQKADIIVKNVSFQYDGPRSRKVLNDISLIIPHDKITAIVGVSGSGKTTLLKLILGFYEPTKGEILLNNIPLNNYNSKEWRASCGVVMQEGFIFSDTIANNIAASDEILEMEKVKNAAGVANLQSYINALSRGYNTIIGVDGSGLSSGQKQRILIARAVYKNAQFLIFDEATNALDANNELVIMNNLSKFFNDKTTIIVAHRLSTVKNADNIVVLNDGIIVEQGNHKELVTKKGHYYSLVKNQLELGL